MRINSIRLIFTVFILLFALMHIDASFKGADSAQYQEGLGDAAEPGNAQEEELKTRQLAAELSKQEQKLRQEELRKQKAEELARQREDQAREKEALRKQKALEKKRRQEEVKARTEQKKQELAEAQEEARALERQRQWQLAEESQRKQALLTQAKAEELFIEEARRQASAEAAQALRLKQGERLQQLAQEKEEQDKFLAAQKEEEKRRLQELRDQMRVKEERHLWELAEERKQIERELAVKNLERQLKLEASRKAKEENRIEAKMRAEERIRLSELERQRRIEVLAARKLQEQRRQEELNAQASLQEEVLRRQRMEQQERRYVDAAQSSSFQISRLELARQEREQAERELKIRQEERLKEQAVEKLRREELLAQEGERSRIELAAKNRKALESAQKQEEEAKAKEEITRRARVKEEEARERAQAKEEERLKKLAAAKEQQAEQEKARQEQILRQQKELEKKLAQSTREASQSKAMTDVMLVKQREDNAKIDKIERLWRKSRKLYAEEKYEEASRIFEEIIELEGNPRIKYTPYAKIYLEKAKEKIEEKKKYAASVSIEHMDKQMMQEVLIKQVPPYMEPPKRFESKESKDDERLLDMPLVRKKLQKTITLDFDKLDLKSVVNFLSQESGVNIIASAKVLEMGLKVTARYKDTAAEEAIKYITKSLGLLYRIDKDLVWIAHPEEVAKEPLETRVYYLSKGAGLFTEFSPISSGSSGETGLGGSSAQINKMRTLEDTLKDAVPWPTDSKLVYDKRVNALLVRNTPQNLQMLEDILFTIDVTPFQILIEARFIEVEMTDIDQLGFEWKLTNETFPIQTKKGSGETVHGVAEDSGVNFSAFSRASEGLNLTYKGLLTTPQFETVLHALSESQKVKTLSSPRITTLNNQMATIKVVDEWIYPTRYEYEIVQQDVNGDGDYNDAGETSYKNVPKDFLRRDVGILLKVIPSIGADKKTITLSLIPEVSEGTAGVYTYEGGVSLPKFTSRNLSTTVVVRSGDTVVLGGLIKESRTKTVTKVPVLGDLPLVGGIFRKSSDSIVRKNLIIFVTAKMLSPSGEEIVLTK